MSHHHNACGFLGQERGVWIMKDWDDMTPLEEIYAIRLEIAEETLYNTKNAA